MPRRAARDGNVVRTLIVALRSTLTAIIAVNVDRGPAIRAWSTLPSSTPRHLAPFLNAAVDVRLRPRSRKGSARPLRPKRRRTPDVQHPGVADHGAMLSTGSPLIDAERAFGRAARARRRAAIGRRLRRSSPCRLPVYDERQVARTAARRGIREIPLSAIRGTTEPARARLFDADFRPARAAQTRWQRVWLAELRGAVLPPISVVPVDGGYAVRDGHHRVSVARARGALMIDATMDSLPRQTAGTVAYHGDRDARPAR